ncbi:hypothetical protein MSVAZ_0844 [Methanosarcina vacuolata Z-761]|uniref:Uncharacterized protein n=2 Tax=Methanosarcina vacuolata TaxID=2215 RepID=A0A0E3Q3C3_9EURY|nr:hypothetical protein MSVAZ_0844 [Methanosarcina vacuolata Z-761]
MKDLKKVVDLECPDVIHSFDEDAFFFGSLLSFVYKKPYIHTKCGGANPRIALPKVNNLILYSQENFKYYQSSRRFKKANIQYIPNRVGTINQNFYKINNLKSSIGSDSSKIFLIISRIDESKKNDILQTINLVKRLNIEGVKAKLIIVGVIQDEKTGEEIKTTVDSNIYLFTDDEYAINASQLIDVADFVVGGGRSFMEAASRGKIMLCPLKNSKYPLLITEKNFDKAFNQNFSSRITIDDFDPDENYQQISQALIDEKYANEITIFIKSASNKYFEIDSQLTKYYEIYSKIKYKPCFNIFDLTAQFFRLKVCNKLTF